jgi:hypothetical protein
VYLGGYSACLADLTVFVALLRALVLEWFVALLLLLLFVLLSAL